MRRRWSWLLLTPLILAGTAPSAPVADAGDPAVIEAAFREGAARSLSARSGDIFTLVNPYNYVIEPAYAQAETSTLRRNGKDETLAHRGTSHGSMWRYDTQVPIIWYGPGRIKAGHRSTVAACQQDIPATTAALIGAIAPRDNVGRVQTEALLPSATPPKAVLTIVIDQGGRQLYAAHPDAHPNIDRLAKEGTDFVNGRVAHLEAETALGHAAVGTGAFPDRSGIPSNDFFYGGRGATTYSFDADEKHSPLFLESPTLAETWLRATDQKAVVFGLCFTDRAVICTVGHGSYFAGNDKTMAVYYDENTGTYTTNTRYYRLPDYLADFQAKTYWERLTQGTGRWRGHDIANPQVVRRTPAYAAMDGDAYVRMIEREAVGADNVPDLLYLTLKSTDAAGHQYGYESEEARDVLVETDRQVGRVVSALERKVGKGNAVVVLTADHGATPLVELSGGSRLLDDDLLAALNRTFPSKHPRFPVALAASGTQVWLDDQAMRASGVTRQAIVTFLQGLKVDGRPFYRLVLDASVIEQERARWIASHAR
jgi:predicted AlkP superfamily pyrophosphatase or phosphodiesterase